MIHQNTVGVNLLVWEVDPELRNDNNVIQFYSSEEIADGDMIIGMWAETGISLYEIESVIEKRDCKLKKNNHYTAKTKWSGQQRSFFEDKDLSKCSASFEVFVKGKRAA